MSACNCFDSRLKGLNIISRLQRVIKLEIDFVLTQPHFVMSDLNLQTHHVQGGDDFSANPDSLIVCRKIKITTDIIGHRMSFFGTIPQKQVKLRFRTDVVGPAAFLFDLLKNSL